MLIIMANEIGRKTNFINIYNCCLKYTSYIKHSNSHISLVFDCFHESYCRIPGFHKNNIYEYVDQMWDMV